MRKLCLFAGSAIIATGLGLGSASATNLIVNGDFSSPPVGTNWSIFPNGGVPGWTSNNNETEIDYQLVVMPTFYLGVPGQSVELNGNVPDTISQTVNGLTIGQKYLLSWGYGDRPGGGCCYEAQVYFGGSLVNTDFGKDSGLWTTNSFLVTATAKSETLSFMGIADGSSPSYGNEIADVSVTSAAPEPATWAMLLAGFAALGFMVRGSRRKAVPLAA